MSNHIRLHKGLNLPLKGEAQDQITKTIPDGVVAIKPTDFKAFNARLLVKEGDPVKIGSPVMADKQNPKIVLTSPVSGKVLQIVRGAKRKLLAVTLESDGSNNAINFSLADPHKATREEVIEFLTQSGLWVALKQRPYGTIANPEESPKAIFISGFDSSPLAPNLDFALKGEMENIQRGINLVSKLTKGATHLSFHNSNYASTPLHKMEGVVTHTFSGPHPSGNVGVQIHHISPINKGEVVWTIDLFSLAAIGRLLERPTLNLRRVIAITGPRANNPSYIETLPGVSMKEIASYASKESVEYKSDWGENLPVRYISGNALTGENVGADGYLGFFHNQITLLSEGEYREPFGWIKPFRIKKFSISRSYFSWLLPKKSYSLDTNLNGGERAFVMTGLYEKVVPMDIYPLYLIKAILAKNIDQMEALGIYEVIEEDFALCDFICPSKSEIQQILSDGIELMIKEMS